MTHEKKLLAFAATTSRNSINKELVTYAASLTQGYSVEVVDLNDYELPLFNVDLEREIGQPENARRFFEKIGEADALLISLAEHNASYSAAYKNLFDWCSRINMKVYQGKPLILLATSPGQRGGKSVLEFATNTVSFFGADLKASYSLPSFNDHFSDGRITTESFNNELIQAIGKFDSE